MINNVAEKRLVNLSSSSHRKMQSAGKSCYIDGLWSDPLSTVMEKMINQSILVVKVNYLVISK